MVRPVKLACGGFFSLIAFCPNAPFQPESTPSKPLKRNAAGPFGNLKPWPPANAMPQGKPPVTSVGEGIFTGGLAMPPSAVYNSLTCPPTEFTHAIPLGLQAMPNPFSKVGSMVTG